MSGRADGSRFAEVLNAVDVCGGSIADSHCELREQANGVVFRGSTVAARYEVIE